MPRVGLWLMRVAVEVMLTVIRRWEDKHADHSDHRMRELNQGLWQASQSLRQVLAGQFTPMRRQSHVWDLRTGSSGERYTRELLSGVPGQSRHSE
jgi:hypothetical protein